MHFCGSLCALSSGHPSVQRSDGFTSAKQHSNGTGSEKETAPSVTWEAAVTTSGMASNHFLLLVFPDVS